MKVRVIVNPFSGARRGRKIIKELTKFKEELFEKHDIFFDIVFVSRNRTAFSLAKDALKRNFNRVIAVGGDGTVQAVVNALAGSDISLGIIPAGTGNDFALTLGIPRNPKKALKVALFGKAVSFDLGKVDNRFFINVASFGLDAKIVYRFAALRDKYPFFPTLALHLFAIFVELFFCLRYPKIKTTFFTPEEVFSEEMETTDLVVANGQKYGMILKAAPESSFKDGFLDICWIEKIGKWKILRVVFEASRGAHLKFPEITLTKFSALMVSSEEELACQADGEAIKPKKEYKISVAPGALKVVVPDDFEL